VLQQAGEKGREGEKRLSLSISNREKRGTFLLGKGQPESSKGRTSWQNYGRGREKKERAPSHWWKGKERRTVDFTGNHLGLKSGKKKARRLEERGGNGGVGVRRKKSLLRGGYRDGTMGKFYY